MANLNFFAAEADQKAVTDFLFSETSVRVFESYSEPDAEIREFSSTDDLMAAFPLGYDKHGNGHELLLQLWSPDVMRELTIRRFALDPLACSGHTLRHCIEGGVLIQLYFGGINNRVVTQSHFGHQSQKRAQAWGVDQDCDWDSLKRLSNRIQYHIRKIAVAKVPGCPVLPQAFELATAGYALKAAVQTPWEYELQPTNDRRKKPSG